MKTTPARPSRSALALLAAACLCAGAASALGQGGPTTEILATTGPGTLSDVPGEPAGTTFLSFGAPSIYDPYGLGDLAMIQPPAGAAPLAAIVRLQPPLLMGGAIVAPLAVKGSGVLVRAGDPVPDVNDAIFTKFGQPVFGGGHFGFLGTIAGGTVSKDTDTGLWCDVNGSLDLVAREGGPAQDEFGNDLPGVTFSSFLSYVLPDRSAYVDFYPRLFGTPPDRGLIFLAKINGTGVSAKNNLGVWVQFNGQVRLAFRTGQMVTLHDPKGKDEPLAIKGLQLLVPSKDIPGQRRSYNSEGVTMALATFAKSRQAVLVSAVDLASPSHSSFFKVVVENKSNVGSLAIPSANFFNGTFAMRTNLTHGAVLTADGTTKVTGKNDTVIIVGFSQTNIDVIAQEGDPFSGVPNSTYKKFSEPAIADYFSTVVFTAQLAGPGINAGNDTVLTRNGDGFIARTGDHATGTPMNVLWKSFTSFALPSLDSDTFTSNNFSETGPYFLGTLTGPGIDATNDAGLWGRDKNGVLYLLARSGDPLTVNGVDRTVSLISTLNAVADSPGQERFVGQERNIVAHITFTDHSTALVRFTMPPAQGP